MYSVYVCVMCVHKCLHVPGGGHWLYCFIICIPALWQGPSLHLDLGWWPAGPSNPPVSTLIIIRMVGLYNHTWLFTWVVGIWISLFMLAQLALLATRPSVSSVHPQSWLLTNLGDTYMKIITLFFISLNIFVIQKHSVKICWSSTIFYRDPSHPSWYHKECSQEPM